MKTREAVAWQASQPLAMFVADHVAHHAGILRG